MKLKKTCTAILISASIPLTVSAKLPKEFMYKEVVNCPKGVNYYYLSSFGQSLFVSNDVMLETNLIFLQDNKFELYVEEHTDVIINPPSGSDYSFHMGRNKLIKGQYEEKDGEVILEGVGIGTIEKPDQFNQLRLDLDLEVFGYDLNGVSITYQRASANHSHYSKATYCE